MINKLNISQIVENLNRYIERLNPFHPTRCHLLFLRFKKLSSFMSQQELPCPTSTEIPASIAKLLKKSLPNYTSLTNPNKSIERYWQFRTKIEPQRIAFLFHNPVVLSFNHPKIMDALYYATTFRLPYIILRKPLPRRDCLPWNPPIAAEQVPHPHGLAPPQTLGFHHLDAKSQHTMACRLVQ